MAAIWLLRRVRQSTAGFVVAGIGFAPCALIIGGSIQVEAPVVDRAADRLKGLRLGKIQRSVVNYLQDRGGQHVFIGVRQFDGRIGAPFSGYEVEAVQRSLELLRRRRIISTVNSHFHYLEVAIREPGL